MGMPVGGGSSHRTAHHRIGITTKLRRIYQSILSLSTTCTNPVYRLHHHNTIIMVIYVHISKGKLFLSLFDRERIQN